MAAAHIQATVVAAVAPVAPAGRRSGPARWSHNRYRNRLALIGSRLLIVLIRLRRLLVILVRLRGLLIALIRLSRLLVVLLRGLLLPRRLLIVLLCGLLSRSRRQVAICRGQVGVGRIRRLIVLRLLVLRVVVLSAV